MMNNLIEETKDYYKKSAPDNYTEFFEYLKHDLKHHWIKILKNFTNCWFSCCAYDKILVFTEFMLDTKQRNKFLEMLSYRCVDEKGMRDQSH